MVPKWVRRLQTQKCRSRVLAVADAQRGGVGKLTVVRLIPILVFALGAWAADRPPSPFIDRGACPFECCLYRQWRALRPVVVVDRPRGNRAVGRLREGEWVSALTG